MIRRRLHPDPESRPRQPAGDSQVAPIVAVEERDGDPLPARLLQRCGLLAVGTGKLGSYNRAEIGERT
jgi:hypothetical protein